MNKPDLEEFLNNEGTEIDWCGTAEVFEWKRAHNGFIVPGDAIMPEITAYTKLTVK
jgi:hypothetical protein